jgi:hypothetical protein
MAVAVPTPSFEQTTNTALIDDTMHNVAGKLPGPTLAIVNSPSDGSERGRGNAWVILKKQ